MALLNQSCIVHYDKIGNISRYIIAEKNLYLTRWEKKKGVDKNRIIAKDIEEIKACSDNNDNLFLFCLNSEGEIEILKIFGLEITRSIFIPDRKDYVLKDYKPYLLGERIELIITYSTKYKKEERILQKYSLDICGILNNQKYIDFTEKSIMIYETVGPVDVIASVNSYENEFEIISIIEKEEKSNSIILLRDNRFGYVEGLVKISMNYEIFWHDIFLKEHTILIVFTVRDGNSFSIRYTEFDIENRTILSEITIREKSNCSHPIFVHYLGEIWICWYENGSVYSTIINDKEMDAGIKKWKNSSGKKVFCAEIIVDSEEIKNEYDLKCRKVFVTYPKNNITGVGSYHK